MDDSITVAQALRHARHDFLNELQLIQMKLDLGRGQDVKSIIRSRAEAAVQLNKLSALKMPAAEHWLLTAEWRFPEFRFHLECLAQAGITTKDAAFADWLEQFFSSLKEQADTASDISCRTVLKERQSDFEIGLDLNGNLPDINLPEVPGLLARKEIAADSLKIIVSAKMEG
ncbi:Spo0B domain-containing protein [Planomicrobium sp. Y74]|uniref:Spo0B domain-containing protein n=1 Tax=Planomicrobium sp. Y74 TaxID=2478977 RepID=UPI000EF47567|nr:Spo0B domain-containing protein [Planomicrobium sp. Y74]RLQ92001.1 sporulation protein [Planomicrobium sp. Y74]